MWYCHSVVEKVALVGNLVEHVVQIVDRVDDFADVRLLKSRDPRPGQSEEIDPFDPRNITVGQAHVVGGMEGMGLPTPPA